MRGIPPETADIAPPKEYLESKFGIRIVCTEAQSEFEVPVKEISFSLYELQEYYRAPETAGVYAWVLYASINTRKAQSPSEMAADLSEYERIAKQQSIELKSIGEFFKSKWEGVVNLESKEWSEGDVSTDDSELAIATAKHFNNIMSALAPVLYVGKADNLRSRIENHVNAIEKIGNWEYIDLDSEGKYFAERVHKSSISPSSLRFTFFPFPDVDVDRNSVIDANRKVEGFINRILKPNLGRR